MLIKLIQTNNYTQNRIYYDLQIFFQIVINSIL